MYCTIAKTDREYYWPRVNCFFFLHIILSSQCLWKRVEERSWRLISMSCGCSTEKLLSHMDIWRERLHCTVVQHTHAAWIWCVCSTRTATLFSPTVIYVLLIFAFFFYAWKKEIRVVSSRGHWVSCLLLFFAAAAAVFCLLPYVIQRCAICNCCMHRHAWVCPTTVSTLRSASTTVDERLVFAHRHLSFCCCCFCCCQFATVQARRTLSAADRVQLFSTYFFVSICRVCANIVWQ